jgi:uncharacterized protein involved in exopolysaccharide biosynthesis
MKDKYYDDPQIVEEEYEEIDIMELLRKLVRSWKRIAKWCAIAAVAGVVIALSLPNEYSVSSKMAPESVSRSGGGSLSSLASLAGISLGSVSTSDAVYPDLYPDIVSSTPFVVEFFPVQVSFKDGKETVTTDYYTYLKEYQKSPWWGAVLHAPFKALGWFLGLFREKTEPVEGFAALDPSALTYEQEEIAKAVRKSIQLGVDKKNSVITLTVTAQDPQVAAVISEEVIERLKVYVTNYRTEKSRKDVEYYETLYNEARDAYFTSQQAYANYVDRNQGVILQRVKTEQERLQNEMNLNYQLYNACAQQLQGARAKVQQETPVFTIINPPQVPNKKSKPKRATILAACIFLGGIAAAVYILWGPDPKKKEEEEGAPAKA